MKIVIIGLGRMGTLQARVARHFGDEIVAGIDIDCNARSAFFATFNCPVFESIELAHSALSAAELVWLTVIDGAIEAVAKSLVGRLSERCVVIHTSGATSSEVLSSHLSQPCASLHPLFACPPVTVGDEDCVSRLCGIYHVIEGSPFACDIAKQLVARFSGKLAVIDVQKKALYHAAAVFASNYPVTLIDAAQKLFVDCGFDELSARDASCLLLQSALNSLISKSPADALTGPAKRRDTITIEKHRQSLLAFPEYHSLYEALLASTRSMLDQDS